MKQTLPELLRLAADIEQAKLDGKPPIKWEYLKDGLWSPGYDSYLILSILANYDEIRRAPLTFPDPPEGREWQNPDNLTPEQVGVPEWRLLLRGESRDPTNQEYFSDEWEPLSSGESKDQLAGLTYRTRAPLPAPAPARVPLTAADVPVGSAIRGAGEIDGRGWCIITSASETGIRIWRNWDPGGQDEWRWADLMKDDVQILRPGQDWQPCSKPAE